MAQASVDSVVINLHYGDGQERRLRIYKGTFVGDIERSIRNIVGFDNILCVDAGGIAVVLSGSTMPNNLDVYVQGNEVSVNNEEEEVKAPPPEIVTPKIYGYADRTGAENQNYLFDNNGFGEVIVFTSTTGGRYNVGNMYNPQNGRFVAPVDGIYTFTVSAWLLGDGQTSRSAQLWFHYDGHRQQTFTSPTNATSSIFAGSLTTRIEKNHFVDFRFYQHNLRNQHKKIATNFYHTFVRWSLVQAV